MIFRVFVIFVLAFPPGFLLLAQDASSTAPTNESADGGAANVQTAEPATRKATTVIDPEIPLDQLEVMVKPLLKAELQVEADAWFELLHQKARQISATRLGVKKTNEAIAINDAASAAKTLETAEKVRQNIETAAEQASQAIVDSSQENLGIEATEQTETQSTPEASDASPVGESPATDSGQDGEAVTQKAEALKTELLADVNVLQDERTAIADRLNIVLDSLEGKGGDVEEYRKYVTAVSGVELDTSDFSATWSGVVGWVTSKEGGQRLAWNLGKFLLILFITYLIAKLVARIVNWLLERKIHLTQLAERLIASTITNIIMLVGFAVALTALEIDITPILAAIGATGLVVGLALQGTLSNFASGLMILINRPFDVGDVVTAAGVTGKVNQMNLVSTTFRTFDNQTIHVPNNEIWQNVITNITANKTRRVDLEFGIGYSDDFEIAEKIIQEIVSDHPLIHDDPAPEVVTHALADSSVNIICRPWAATSDWWKVKTDVTREVKRRFDQAGISIPYPQTDIHVHGLQNGSA